MSTADDRTKQIAEHASACTTPATRSRNDDPNPNHAHQHQYEHRYDYDPVGCPSAVVLALFAFAPVSHDNSTLAMNGHPTPAPCMMGR